MYELVELKGNDVFTNSKVIADGTNNQHESVVAIIRKYEKDILDFGNIDFSDLKSGKRGQPERVYYLNEEQATFVITLLRNSKIVVKFKKELVRQFYAMRRFILEKQSKLWGETRIANKENRLKETDVIKLLVDYAKEQGSTHSDKLYVTFTKLAKSVIILQTIRIDMSMGMHYKDIYRDCKNRIEQFADITYLSA